MPHAPTTTPSQLLAQAAKTAQLLGVDFMPLGQPGATLAEAEPVSAPSVAGPAGPAVAVRSANPKQAALDDLRERYEADAPHAPFISEFNNIVFGDGDPDARLMFIGEAPGAEEDRTGKPFVGRAGELLNKMIIAMGLSRESVYIANVLKVRPPGNATPTPQEAEASKPFLFEQIAIIRPEVIVTLGLPAARTILNREGTLSSMRGIWASFRSERTPHGEPIDIPVMPTFHPAFLLRAYTDENRAKVWSDLKQAMTRLGLGKK